MRTVSTMTSNHVDINRHYNSAMFIPDFTFYLGLTEKNLTTPIKILDLRVELAFDDYCCTSRALDLLKNVILRHAIRHLNANDSLIFLRHNHCNNNQPNWLNNKCLAIWQHYPMTSAILRDDLSV